MDLKHLRQTKASRLELMLGIAQSENLAMPATKTVTADNGWCLDKGRGRQHEDTPTAETLSSSIKFKVYIRSSLYICPEKYQFKKGTKNAEHQAIYRKTP